MTSRRPSSRRATAHGPAALLRLVCVALVPSLAHAGPIENGVDWLLDLLTNGMARSVAIIALAILGCMAFAGKLTLEAAVKFMAGIVLIFGGATLGHLRR